MALVELLQGLRAVDVGPLSRARSIEHMTALAIAINRRHKITTRGFASSGSMSVRMSWILFFNS